MENTKMYRMLVILTVCAILSGCGMLSGYKPTIEQGNIYSEELAAKLKPGMSRAQCAYVLGNSILEPTFKNNRWDYVYTLKPRGSDKTYKKYLTLYFDGNTLSHIESSTRP